MEIASLLLNLLVICFIVGLVAGFVWAVRRHNKGEHWSIDPEDVYRYIDGQIVARGSYLKDKGHWVAYIYPDLKECVFHSEFDMLKFMETAKARPPKPDKSKEVKAALKQLEKNRRGKDMNEI